MRRYRHTATDHDEALEVLSTAYTRLRHRHLEDGHGPSFLLDGAATESFGIDRLRHHINRVVADADPVGDHLVFTPLPHDGQLRLTSRDRQEASASVMLAPRTMPCRLEWRHLDVVTVSVDPEATARLGAEASGLDPADVTFTAMTPRTPGLGRYWTRLTGLVARELLADDELMAQPLMRDHAFRQLASGLLAVFPNTTHDHAHPTGRDEGEPAVVRRAVEFIETHAGRPIGITDIAAAAHIGPRGLQAAFARHRDTTPMAHLRRVRLEHARRDLQAGDPTRGDTVAGIAAAWGFAHPGRFSVTYHQHYGQPPGHTLRG